MFNDLKMIQRRETIYESLQGTKVERIYCEGEQSYIYKPLGFAQTKGREQWVQKTIVPHVPDIRIPRILAVAEPPASETYGLLYEDLGQLRHPNTATDLIEAAGWIPLWQRLPASLVPERWEGHSPPFLEVWKSVSASALTLHKRIEGCSREVIQAWLPSLSDAPALLAKAAVVSHGDYHPYNVAFLGSERIVLDWEFIHLNHPYWDIYSLLDMTSFRFTKINLLPEHRLAALRRYWNQSETVQQYKQWDAFVSGYYVYASVYSAWISGLIEQDLHNGRAAREQLLAQKQQTSLVFTDCLRALGYE